MYKDFTKVNFKDEAQAKESFRKFELAIDNIVKLVAKIKDVDLVADTTIFLEVLEKTQQDILKADTEMNSGSNVFKQYGYFCYWIKRLKPFKNVDIFGHYTNEILSVLFSLYIISHNSCKTSKLTLNKAFYTELYYLMRFEDLSKDGIAMIFTSLYKDCYNELYSK